VPGSDSLEQWRAALLADDNGVPVVAVRDARIHRANDAARALFSNLHLGMGVDELAEESCRHKLSDHLREGASGKTVEIEITQRAGAPTPARFLLLTSAHEQLLVGVGIGMGYTDEIGAKLIATNAELANTARELSQRMHELETTRRAMQGLADQRELFIAALAHDLRGPLSVILLSESALRARPPPLLAMELSSHGDKVERSAKRMLKLIDSLLFATQLDSSNSLTEQSLERLSLDQIAHETADDLGPLAAEGDVRIVVADSDRTFVRGNRAWLGQVFANLLTNAIRHSPAGSRVGVNVSTDGSSVRCTITDQGPGVPVEERERIFHRFVQHGDRRGSVGLGLYICRKIIHLHGGHIWIEDAPAGGARFVFRIPTERDSSRAPAPK
jgi:signal transduction histidine kinase